MFDSLFLQPTSEFTVEETFRAFLERLERLSDLQLDHLSQFLPQVLLSWFFYGFHPADYEVKAGS